MNIAASRGANIKLQVKKGAQDRAGSEFRDSIEQTHRGDGQQRGSQGSQTVASS